MSKRTFYRHVNKKVLSMFKGDTGGNENMQVDSPDEIDPCASYSDMPTHGTY